MIAEWRYYRMTTGSGGPVERFYAPSLDAAFSLARGRWPWAPAWHCLGSDKE